MSSTRRRLWQECKYELCRQVVDPYKHIYAVATDCVVGMEPPRNLLTSKFREALGGPEPESGLNVSRSSNWNLRTRS